MTWRRYSAAWPLLVAWWGRVGPLHGLLVNLVTLRDDRLQGDAAARGGGAVHVPARRLVVLYGRVHAAEVQRVVRCSPAAPGNGKSPSCPTCRSCRARSGVSGSGRVIPRGSRTTPPLGSELN